MLMDRSVATIACSVKGPLKENCHAEGIRKGKSVSPDFDVAVKRHQLLHVFQKASDTDIRQIL